MHKILLHLRQLNGGAVVLLAFLIGSDAADVDDDVCRERVADGFRLKFWKRTRWSGRSTTKPPATAGFGRNRTALGVGHINVFQFPAGVP